MVIVWLSLMIRGDKKKRQVLMLRCPLDPEVNQSAGVYRVSSPAESSSQSPPSFEDTQVYLLPGFIVASYLAGLSHMIIISSLIYKYKSTRWKQSLLRHAESWIVYLELQANSFVHGGSARSVKLVLEEIRSKVFYRHATTSRIDNLIESRHRIGLVIYNSFYHTHKHYTPLRVTGEGHEFDSGCLPLLILHLMYCCQNSENSPLSAAGLCARDSISPSSKLILPGLLCDVITNQSLKCILLQCSKLRQFIVIQYDD